MHESYRNSALRGVRCSGPLRISFIVAAAFVAASAAAGDFSAKDVPSAHFRQTGKVVVSNDGSRITAYHFFGDIRESLFTLRSVRAALHYTPFGSALFDANARVTTPMPAYLSALIVDASKQHGVDPRLVAAIAARESAYNSAAVSPVGAGGVMQLMPATARYIGVSNIFDARENVFGGVRYLRTLLDTFHGDLDLTLAAYNAGPGAVQKYNGVPPYRETRDYVRTVRATYEASLKR
jgi:soluble lytic murein transglycosylase-like protein